MFVIGNNVIVVQDIPITVNISDREDYICITDIAKAKIGNSKSDDIIKKLA